MASTKFIEVPKVYAHCVGRYHWWWRDLPATLKQAESDSGSLGQGLRLSEKVFWDLFSDSAYLYELHKRVTGAYRFGSAWPQLSTFKKVELMGVVNKTKVRTCDADPLRAYLGIREELVSILKRKKCTRNDLVSGENWESIVDLVFQELDERVRKEIESKAKGRPELWTAVNLNAYNLTQSKERLLYFFTGWLEKQHEQLCGDNPWTQRNEANAVKLFPRLEAYDLVHGEKATLASIPSNYQYNYKKAKADIPQTKKIDSLAVAEPL